MSISSSILLVLTFSTGAIPTTAENCDKLLEILDHVVRAGSQLSITRKVIPLGVYGILRNPTVSITIEQNAILAEVYLVVQDYWGLFSVRY